MYLTKKLFMTKETTIEDINKTLIKISKRRGQGVSGLDMCTLICGLFRPSRKGTKEYVSPKEFWGIKFQAKIFCR